MLDQNLPTFFLKAFANNGQESIVHLSQHGQDPAPAYTFCRPDPSQQTSKNCYSLALFDSYNPEVLFGEVLIRPQWTQPTLSADEIRRNGGVPPPPQPVIPTEFVIQLYSPDQQIRVRQKPGSWGGSAYWEFEVPQRSFREPSASSLDRSQNDPAAAATTPRLCFRWRKDGKLSKDLVCSLSGKSSDAEGKKKSSSKEPDIAISLFKHLKEITIYEPNLTRVDLEDFKGLEVILLLSASVIKDLWFGNVRETLNLVPPQARGNGSLSPKPTSPIAHGALSPPMPLPQGRNDVPSGSTPRLQQPFQANFDPAIDGRNSQDLSPRRPINQTQPPPADARSQWEIDNETARLRQQHEAETRERERVEEAERRRVKKMVEAEEKAERRRQAEVDKETERLRKVYAAEEKEARRRNRPPSAYARHSTSQSHTQGPFPTFQHPPQQQQQQQHHRPQYPSQPPQPQVQVPYQGPYLQPFNRPAANNASSSGFFPPNGGGNARPLSTDGNRHSAPPKRSFLGLRTHSEDVGKLNKKRSSIF